MAIFIESEIWPNIINSLNKRNIKQILINARITKKSFSKSVFFCNSGTEDIEAGVKVIRKYFNDK